MRAILVLAALIAAAPAVAGAQDATERRRQQSLENLRQMEQNQRIGEVERQLSNIELRAQSESALRAIQAPAEITRQNTLIVPQPIIPQPLIVPRALTAEERARDAELAASNARLRQIGAGQRSGQ